MRPRGDIVPPPKDGVGLDQKTYLSADALGELRAPGLIPRSPQPSNRLSAIGNCLASISHERAGPNGPIRAALYRPPSRHSLS
jgi:hypothetical protein